MNDERSVFTDADGEMGHPAKLGELISIYTATRAWRGHLLGVSKEHFILGPSQIVWTADASNVNGNKSAYFVHGSVPKGVTEEESGASFVMVSKGGTCYSVAHGGKLIDLPTLKDFDAMKGGPVIGATVHVCTVSHEFHGKVAAWGYEFIRLTEAAMVNDCENNFAKVLAEAEKGQDHVLIADVDIRLSAVTAIAVR